MGAAIDSFLAGAPVLLAHLPHTPMDLRANTGALSHERYFIRTNYLFTNNFFCGC